MIREKLGVDRKDIAIMDMFMQDPDISQNEVANRLSLSQPSVNFRIQKLKNKGILTSSVGIDFNKTNLFLTRVDFTATDANAVLNKLKKCTFFVNGFIMAGKDNVSVFLANEDLRKVETIINDHLRSDPTVSNVNVNVIVSCANDFLIKMNLVGELDKKNCRDLYGCKKCEDLNKKK